MVEENILAETVLEIGIRVQLVELGIHEIIVGPVRIRHGGKDIAFHAVLPQTPIVAVAVVAVRQADEDLGVRIKVAVHRRAAVCRREHVKLHPIVVPQVNFLRLLRVVGLVDVHRRERAVVHVEGLGVPGEGAVRGARLRVAVDAVPQDFVILALIGVLIRDDVAVGIAQILPRDTAVTVVGAALAQCGEDRVVCSDVR